MFKNSEKKRLLELTKAFLKSSASALQIEDLREVLHFHEWNYSINNEPLISDFEYDQLFKALEAIETEFPNLISPSSPTQRVAVDIVDNASTIKHLSPMLSLDNSYNADDLKSFDESIKKLTGLPAEETIVYCVEPKFDGGSVGIVFENDLLARAATRGNGTLGEDMTANAKTLPTVPLSADFSKHGIHTAELRGEAVIHKDRFKKINKERESNGKSVFANPRNAAAGGLRMKNPNETRARGIEIFLFQMGYAVDQNGNDLLPSLDSHFDQINLLAELGFKVPTIEKKQCSGIQEVIDLITSWEGKREDYPYEIDGMVVKVDSHALQVKCGFTQHHPRWAIAYKFKAKQASTKLLGIDYQIGKIGSITPVAKLEPVQLAGVTISSVSLHNEEFIQSKDLRIGDTVLVERAGDVIPYIVKSLEDYRDGSEKEIEFPTACPSCDTTLVKNENEAAWRCTNALCEAQQMQRLIFHVSKNAMDIDGFGKAFVELFYQKGWLKDLSDVYDLDYNEIAKLEGFGQKSVQNLEAAINVAKQNPISKLLHSLSIHHLGKKASKIIAEHIDHVLDLKEWNAEAFTDIKDIGPVVAENVVAFFSQEENIALLQRMESLGVNLSQTAEDQPLIVAEDAPLAGKTILFTGSLQNMSRKEAQELAAKSGAKNISAVSKNLDILVAGEKAGSKLKKAQAIDTVQILTEAEFLLLINE
jgi:DNA ligase (NAD+)